MAKETDVEGLMTSWKVRTGQLSALERKGGHMVYVLDY